MKCMISKVRILNNLLTYHVKKKAGWFSGEGKENTN